MSRESLGAAAGGRATDDRVCEGRDRVRCVPPNAGELGEVVRPALGGDPLCRAVKVDGAAVVPEPLPRADHVREGRLRKRVEGRPALEPGQVARDDPLDLGLLEHHLRDEDRVRIAGAAPRKVAAETAKPGQKRGFHERDATRETGPEGGPDRLELRLRSRRLISTYYCGHTNRAVHTRRIDPALVELFKLDDPTGSESRGRTSSGVGAATCPQTTAPRFAGAARAFLAATTLPFRS